MASITARCTQCGSAHASGNKETYSVPPKELNHGTGRAHGTERLDCVSCGETTVHNRCGASVPQDAR